MSIRVAERHPFQRFDDIDAALYDSSFELARQAAVKLLAAACPAPGARVLDVACGTGFATFLALNAVGKDGYVLATDISDQMMAVARQRARRESVTNVDFKVMDGARLDVPRGSFDLVTCASALFSFPDIGAALSNWREAVRSGGTVAFTSFTGKTLGPYGWPELNGVLERRLATAGALPPLTQLTSPSQCRIAVTRAGFSNAVSELTDCGYCYDDFEALWREMYGSLFKLRLQGLGDEDVAQLKAELKTAVAPRFESDRPYRANEVIVTRALKP